MRLFTPADMSGECWPTFICVDRQKVLLHGLAVTGELSVYRPHSLLTKIYCGQDLQQHLILLTNLALRPLQRLRCLQSNCFGNRVTAMFSAYVMVNTTAYISISLINVRTFIFHSTQYYKFLGY